MTDETRRILEAALQLSEAERAEVAAILLDGIARGFAIDDVQAAWMDEVRRRMASVERGESSLVDFDDALDRLRARVARVRDQAVRPS